ncbi:hypothetical protein [Methanospirillum lacunae]|uniref:hypothetical protein n=1 Tax=Methanospirillum lacunae TaxID=668570 RepID=UPI0015E850DA|nr:hypothetical protein [Methanospirillum lacunae]
MPTGEGIVQRMSQGMPHSPGDEKGKTGDGSGINSPRFTGLGVLFCMILLPSGEIVRG